MEGLLDSLNENQRLAVEHIDHPLLIFAGPGTGKTRVAVYKLAHLVQERGFRPEEILALTFSDNAASEMEARVEELLPGANGFKISTFHAFCYDIIKEHSLELGINAQSMVFTDEYQQSFLLDNIDNLELEVFKIPARPIDLAKSFQGAIQRFKQENISVDELEDYLSQHEYDEESEELGKQRDFAKAYRLYEDFKASKGLLDFGDMQSLAVNLLRNRPEILAKLRERIKYIIVDEFQDSDFIQLQLVFLLAPEGNITVVGDDDQSIYRFRGAYLTNIIDFKNFFKDKDIESESIVLNTNYRCAGNIQTTASNLIANNPARQEKEIDTNKDAGVTVKIVHFSTDHDQALGLYNNIKELNDDGVPWEDIAILVRRRVDAKQIIEVLEKYRVPYEIIGSREYFREPIVRAVIAYLRTIADPVRYQPSLGLIMNRPVHGILPGDISRLSAFSKDNGLPLWEGLGILDDFEGEKKHLLEFKKQLDNLFGVYGDKGLLILVRTILFGNDFFRVEISRGDTNNIRLLNKFIELTNNYLDIYPEATLTDFLVHLQALMDLGIEDKSEDTATDKIHLMTIHGSKGKEFPHVFLPCINDRHIPSRYQRYKIEIPTELAHGKNITFTMEELHEHEERRLLYVAMTRGEDQLQLSYCDRYGDNKRDTPISAFLKEIMVAEEGFEVIESEEPLEEEGSMLADTATSMLQHRIFHCMNRGDWQAAIDAITALAQQGDANIESLNIPKDQNIKQYISELEELYAEPEQAHIHKAEYSPSKLKTYEDCPKKYYYQYILAIPGEVREYFELGSIVHTVMERVTQRLKDGEDVSEDQALSILDTLWKPSTYQSTEMEKQDREEAERMVKEFLIHQASKPGTILDIERWIKLDLEGRAIRGRVDRIDDLGDTLQVIDYKTSKSQTSRPQLKQDFQMALYWLGTEQQFEKQVSQVGHWYLRMDKEWMVELSEEEREAVLERARDVINGIEQQQFPAKPSYQNCQFCDYSELCDDKGR
jgi:DNA helicase-2/ATP-dependent DNA helicase PcrA